MPYPTDFYKEPSTTFVEQLRQYENMRRQSEAAMMRYLSSPFRMDTFSPASSPENTLILIKKSIKEIKAEAVDEKAQAKVRGKIERLQKLGVMKQAAVLELELQVRVKLMRVQEWNYKVLPYDAIRKFADANKMTATRDGLKVHIDPLDKYCGTTAEAEAKDKIMPDAVLDDLEKAKKRQVFDEFSVLWVEKVKDPLLLGSINGCKDYFLIAVWGEDVSFEQIMKGK